MTENDIDVQQNNDTEEKGNLTVADSKRLFSTVMALLEVKKSA